MACKVGRGLILSRTTARKLSTAMLCVCVSDAAGGMEPGAWRYFGLACSKVLPAVEAEPRNGATKRGLPPLGGIQCVCHYDILCGYMWEALYPVCQ
jgi:hypothetical protein